MKIGSSASAAASLCLMFNTAETAMPHPTPRVRQGPVSRSMEWTPSKYMYSLLYKYFTSELKSFLPTNDVLLDFGSSLGHPLTWCPWACVIHCDQAFEPNEIFLGLINFLTMSDYPKSSEINNGVDIPGCVGPIMSIIGSQMRCEIKLLTDGFQDRTYTMMMIRGQPWITSKKQT